MEILRLICIISIEILTSTISGLCIMATIKACKQRVEVRQHISIILLFISTHLVNLTSLMRGVAMCYENIDQYIHYILVDICILNLDLIPMLIAYRLSVMIRKTGEYNSAPTKFISIFMCANFLISLALSCSDLQHSFLYNYRGYYLSFILLSIGVTLLIVYVKYLSVFKHILENRLKYALLLLIVMHFLRTSMVIFTVSWVAILNNPSFEDALVFMFLNNVYAGTMQHFILVIIKRPEKAEILSPQNDTHLKLSINFQKIDNEIALNLFGILGLLELVNKLFY